MIDKTTGALPYIFKDLSDFKNFVKLRDAFELIIIMDGIFKDYSHIYGN